jgi:hypothetical protein
MGRRIAALIATVVATAVAVVAAHHDDNGHRSVAEDKGPMIIVR